MVRRAAPPLAARRRVPAHGDTGAEGGALIIQAQCLARIELPIGQVAAGMQPAEWRFGLIDGDAARGPTIGQRAATNDTALRQRTRIGKLLGTGHETSPIWFDSCLAITTAL